MPLEIKTHYILELLMRAFPRLVHGRYGQKATLPKRAGKTMEWRQFGALAAIDTPLSEASWGYGGTIPAPQDPTVTNITASPDFYGAYIEYTDDLEMFAIDDVVANYSEVLGEQAGKSMDLLTRAILVAANNNLTYGGNATGVSSLAAGDVMTFKVWAEAYGKLLAEEALPVDGQNYGSVTHPHVWVDMVQDDDIHKSFEAMSRNGKNPFETGVIGVLLNVVINVTSNAYTVSNAGTNGDGTGYYTIFFGKEAFGTFGIEGMTPKDVQLSGEPSRPGGLTGEKINTINFIMKGIGQSGIADPLDEIGTIGWKFHWGGKVLNEDWLSIAITTASLGTQPT
jgi:N4-gp56 family major capsid protein